MAEFKMKVAGQVALVRSLFESTPEYCRAYMTGEEPDFAIETAREDLAFEQEARNAEARQEGFRIRISTDPFLERLSIQRKFAEHLFDHDTLLFHGSTVAIDGQAYLFTARCGTGKSTHTRLWRQVFGDRAVMVNDDKPFLRITEAGVWACGSPWSGKHGLDTNVILPLKGICLLERGPENIIRKAAPQELLERMRHEGYRPLDDGKYPKFLELIDALAEKTPLWCMECNKDPHAAMVSYEAMSRDN